MHWERGTFSRQAHVHVPAGTFEEEHGRLGFTGRASELYHLHPPTGWRTIDGPLKLRAFDVASLWSAPVSETTRVPLLASPDPATVGRGIVIGVERTDVTPDWYRRNADGDELLFIHAGSGVYETDYGMLEYTTGDYVYLPRGVTTRVAPSEPTISFALELMGEELVLPDRGPLGRHAVIDPAVFDVPEPAPRDETGEFEVRVSRRGRLTRLVYPFDPLDVVGWKGDLAPLRANVADLRPVVAERYHLPPSVHATFVAPSTVVATFVPRPVEDRRETMQLPYYHRNIDYDEVMFFHSAAMTRPDIGPGWLTWSPLGIHHGPQPAALERERLGEIPSHHTDVMVMVDTQHALDVTPAAETVEWREFHHNWILD